MASCELHHIPGLMFAHHFVIGAMITALEKRPGRFYSVRVDLLIHILASVMFHGLIFINKTLVASLVVRIGWCTFSCCVFDETVHNRTRSHREEPFTVSASVGHGRMLRTELNIY